MTNVSLHRRDWEEMAAVDPLWAVLSDPAKRFGHWDLEEFLRTGEKEVGELMRVAERLGLPKQRRRAVDFGCGVGRLTRALQKYFPECRGLDISSKMLEQARAVTPACRFEQGDNLRGLADSSADFIYSSLVLQHQPDQKMVGVLVADMVRVLAPGGLLVFQLPLRIPVRNRLQLRRRAYRLLRALGVSHKFAYERLKLTPIRMLSLPKEKVIGIVKEGGGTVLEVEERVEDGWLPNGIYFCTKNA